MEERATVAGTAVGERAEPRDETARRRRTWPGSRADARASAAIVGAVAILTTWLGFADGGYFAGPTAHATLAVCGLLVVWATSSSAPLGGLTRMGVVAGGALALLAALTLASAQWSDAPARATLEYDRTLLYLGVLALLACAPGGTRHARWLLRLVGLGFAGLVIAGLVSRLYPGTFDVPPTPRDDRLSWPIGYWNALGMAAAMALVIAVHLTTDLREARPVRVLAAATAPALIAALALTLSRGGFAGAAIGLVVLIALARARGTLTGLLAVAPLGALAAVAAYGAGALTGRDPTGAAAAAQGGDLAGRVALLCAGAALVRVAGLRLDARLARLELRPWSRARKAAIATAVVIAAAGVALAADAPGQVADRWDRFAAGGSIPTAEDDRGRLFSTSANGRIEHWDVALQAWRDAPWLGQGAGTYAHDWALRRPLEFAVVEGHSLYLEMLGELGVAGLALLATALLAPLVALMRRRREDRVLWSAVLAVAVAWMVRAALDWDWEMPVLTLPVLALLGAACARDIARGEAPGAVAGAAQARRGRRSGTTRLVAGLAILILALTPWRVSESQRHLDAALAALHGGDCNTAIDRALAAADVANMRPEPFELAGYCDVRIGRAQLGERMLESAVRRDPRSWELHYGLALVRAAAGGDPRPQLRTADRLNPKEPVVDDAIAAFARIGPRRWRETAGTLPIVVPPPAGRSAASSSGTPPK